MTGWRYVLRIVRRKPGQAEAGLSVRKCSSLGRCCERIDAICMLVAGGPIWSCASAVGGRQDAPMCVCLINTDIGTPFSFRASVDVFVLKD